MSDDHPPPSGGDDAVRVLYVGQDEAAVPSISIDDEVVRIETEQDPEIVLERLRNESFDCLVSYYALPDWDGLSLVETVRNEEPWLPVVLIALDGSEELAADAISAGVTEYVPIDSPPPTEFTLTDRVATAVEHYRNRRSEDVRQSDSSLGRVSERYEKIFEYSNDAIMLVDMDRERFLEVNSTACEMLGYDRAELLALEPSDIHPDDIDRLRSEFISEVRSEGAGFTGDMTCLTKDGETVPTEISAAMLHTASSDESTTMVAILRDVSEREAYRAELEQEIERLDRFTGVVTHDLRNPLNVALGRLNHIREEHDQEHVDAIGRSLERMERLIEDLLNVARGGRIADDLEPISLPTIVDSCWQNVATEDARIVVETERTILADRTRLAQLFENLFRNALEHGTSGSNGVETPDSGETVRIVVGDLADGFYVSDDGPGIPPEERERVFEAGYSSTTQGTGFGLSIVQRVAEAHGWSVTLADSARHRDARSGATLSGARFKFTDVEFADEQ